MSKTIAITVSDASHKRLTDVQEKMTKIRQEKIPGASKVNQAEALEWVLKHTLMPISDFQEDSEEVE
jgi:hypothetical protein